MTKFSSKQPVNSTLTADQSLEKRALNVIEVIVKLYLIYVPQNVCIKYQQISLTTSDIYLLLDQVCS